MKLHLIISSFVLILFAVSSSNCVLLNREIFENPACQQACLLLLLPLFISHLLIPHFCVLTQAISWSNVLLHRGANINHVIFEPLERLFMMYTKVRISSERKHSHYIIVRVTVI